VAKKDPCPGSRTRNSTSGSAARARRTKISTRVADSTAKVARKKGGKRGGKASSYDDWKVTDLRRRAKQVGITGRSAMTKTQLNKVLRAS